MKDRYDHLIIFKLITLQSFYNFLLTSLAQINFVLFHYFSGLDTFETFFSLYRRFLLIGI